MPTLEDLNYFSSLPKFSNRNRSNTGLPCYVFTFGPDTVSLQVSTYARKLRKEIMFLHTWTISGCSSQFTVKNYFVINIICCLPVLKWIVMFCAFNGIKSALTVPSRDRKEAAYKYPDK